MTEFEKFYNISILEGISEDQAKLLFNQCKRISFDKNEIIMEEDEEKYSMFFFIDGEVIVSNVITMKVSNQAGFSEVEKSLVRLKAENVGILGEMSVFEAQPRSATVKAYEPVCSMKSKKKNLKILYSKYPDIGVRILVNIATMLCTKGPSRQQGYFEAHTALSIALSK
jgi:CRP-like cAMP-binding protein